MSVLTGSLSARNTAAAGRFRLAGQAIHLALCLTMALAVAPSWAAAPQCRTSLLEENWIRVADIDRSLKLYVNALSFSELSVKNRTLSKKLATADYEGADVRSADLCRARGPTKTLRIIEASPEMIDLPLEDQTLTMQFDVEGLEQLVAVLPENLADRGIWGNLGNQTTFIFEDFDGNRIVLIEAGEAQKP